jgi:predicted nucleotidyltransferase
MREDGGMTKVDERAAVPPLSSALRRQLAEAIDREGTVAGMLFGSQATRTAGPLSDVDVAVWVKPTLSAEDKIAIRSELSLAARDVLGTDEVDVVILNDAAPLLKHRVLKGSDRLFDRDPRTRVRLETAALLDYLDTAPLRATFAAARRRRMEEGRFGRR